MMQTIEEMARDVITKLHPDDIACIKGEKDFGWISFLARCVRNEYKLWWTHPLTKNWRENPEGRDIRDGVDYSKDHPDEISAQVVHRIYEIIEEEV